MNKMSLFGLRVNKFDKLLQMSKKELDKPLDLTDISDAKSRTLRVR